jgi:hypothetical protein
MTCRAARNKPSSPPVPLQTLPWAHRQAAWAYNATHEPGAWELNRQFLARVALDCEVAGLFRASTTFNVKGNFWRYRLWS